MSLSNLLRSLLHQPPRRAATNRSLVFMLASSEEDARAHAIQRLRYRVFVEELGARLATAEPAASKATASMTTASI